SGCGGPSRSDTIMLIRSGLGHSAKLSIPRDTVVDIPGHGPDKINAAFAIGGPALAITTIKHYLGIKINHLVEIDFSNFKKFIDTAGGIDVKTGRVCAQISGGAKNGGWTLDYKPGVHHLSGRQALGYSRMRENPCNPRDSDLTRGQHQQQVLNALKSALISPRTFFHLPWVSWQAPKTIRTDMGGPSLMALMTS